MSDNSTISYPESDPRFSFPGEVGNIARLYEEKFGKSPCKVMALAGAGSNRRYYRLEDEEGVIVVATCGDDIDENRAFIRLSDHLGRECKLPVPEVLAVSDDSKTYLQTWAGGKTLFDLLSSSRMTGTYECKDIELLEEAMRVLARIQYDGGRSLDFGVCYPCKEMDSRLVRWDLNYFKYCFLKPSGLEFDENLLQNEFDRLESCLLQNEDCWKTFMLRDFQSRNVMVDDNGKLTVIDFQGGRRGPGAYDVASFLWQAKAGYPDELRRHLVDIYVKEAKSLDTTFDESEFRKTLPVFVLFRILQTLGAYGFRGWVERKPHFLQSIGPGVDNLAVLLGDDRLASEFPILKELSVELHRRYGCDSEKSRREKYLHKITAVDNPLTVRVTSFSFKKGLPEDSSGNGGGFIFDCRAPHNPGRYEPYKKLTGLDGPVREFLERDGEIKPFVEECERLVDSSVERYLQRGFTDLAVNFGCTGGQHRSVYSADAIARHINDKYGVRVLLAHREQGLAVELPPKDVEVVFDSFLRDPQKRYDPVEGLIDK